jgi:hypothetical protein
MPEPVNGRSYPPAGELVQIFFDAAEAAFRFLSDEFRSPPTRKVWKLDAGGLEPVEIGNMPANSFFAAEVRFEDRTRSVAIEFGDRDFEIRTVISGARSRYENASSYALWEWLEALGVDTAMVTDSMWAFQPDRIRSIVQSMAVALREHQQAILHPEPELVQRLQTLRADRQREWQVAMRAADHRRAAAQAAEAFRAREFAKVVALLEPFAAALSPAERSKLEYARKHVPH